MDTEHERYMKEAIELSRQSVASGGGPFGTVIVSNGGVIARGVSRVTVWNDPTAHGEIVAIREACKHLNSFQLDDCIIYTNSEPCPMCLGAIYWARPQAVYFANSKEDAAAIGFDDAFISKEIDLPNDQRTIPSSQIMRDSALEVFKLWSTKADKVEY